MRVRFTKRGRVRFISHRDTARAMERAMRVVGLPISFTEGFAPRPRISFGLALPTGTESDAEYLDVELTEPVDLDAVVEPLCASLPEGIDVTGAVFLEARADSLQRAVTSASYRCEVRAPGSDTDPQATLPLRDVRAWVRAVLDSDNLVGIRRRKGREVEEDLRPAIRTLSVAGQTSKGVELDIEVATQPRSVRPSEIFAARPVPGASPAEERVVRTHQWIERDGSRLTPLEADTRVRTGIGA